MPAPRRPARALATALAAAGLAFGCGALDELDKANAMLDKSKPAAEGAATDAQADPRRRLEWGNVKSIHKGDLEGRIVRCTVDGVEKFSSPDDCLAQGGTPDAV